MKITGTLPSFASSTPLAKPDVSHVIPARSYVEHSPSTSLIDEPLESDTLPSLSLGAETKDISDGLSSKDLTNNEYELDMMDFPTDEDDMELGNFLLDAADWL